MDNVVPAEGQTTPTTESENQTHVQPSTHWLGETLKEYPSLDKFKEPASLAKSYVELEKGFSSRVPMPKSDAPQEDWDKFYSRMRPQASTEYQIEMPGVDGLDDSKLYKWKESFWNAGLNQRQVNTILENFSREIVEDEQATHQQLIEAETKAQVELKTEWGANYEANKGMILSMLGEVGGDELQGSLGKVMNYDPTIAKFLYESAKVMRASGINVGEGKVNFGMISTSEAQQEKHDIMNNKNNPLYADYHSSTKKGENNPAIKRILELNTVIAKNQPKQVS